MKIAFKVTAKSLALYKAFYEDVLEKTKWKFNTAFSTSIDEISDRDDSRNCIYFSNGIWTPSIAPKGSLPLFAVSHCTNKTVTSFDLGTEYDAALKHAITTGERCILQRLPVCVKLNSDYDAIISGAGVKVGCQMFDFETILSVAAEVKKFNKKIY
jgi:hypothetical protein